MAKVQFQVDGLDANQTSIFNQDVTFDGNIEANSISVQGTNIANIYATQSTLTTAIQSVQAIQGTQGISGAQGTIGLQGTNGTQGISGSQGIQGTVGQTGIQGSTGTQGINGLQGFTGVQGINGTQGTTGLQGFTGIQGTNGLQGTTGSTGLQGTTGTQGITGTQGLQGPSGSYTTSLQLFSSISDETGSGALVFATSPTLVTPILGTPTSGTMTNVTGLPLSTGITGTLATTNGGTGLTTYTSGDIIYASATNTLAKLAKGTNGQALVLSSGLPAWGSVNPLTNTGLDVGDTIYTGSTTPSSPTTGDIWFDTTPAISSDSIIMNIMGAY